MRAVDMRRWFLLDEGVELKGRNGEPSSWRSVMLQRAWPRLVNRFYFLPGFRYVGSCAACYSRTLEHFVGNSFPFSQS